MDTSKISYKEVKEEKIDTNIQSVVLSTLKRIKKGIRSQIAIESGLTESQTWRRLPELEHQGLIRKSGKVFRSKTTGRTQVEWEIVE